MKAFLRRLMVLAIFIMAGCSDAVIASSNLSRVVVLHGGIQ